MPHLEFAICDNDSCAVATLVKYLKQIVPYANIKKYEKGQELQEDLKKRKYWYGAIFLAINMPDQNGINTARGIRELGIKIPIIFISSSEEYYREAFDVFAFQYLLKPLSYMKIKKILDKLKETEGFSDERIIHFRYRSQIYTLEHREICYISSSLHVVNFHLVNGETLCCRGKLSDFDDQLGESNFFRCHQSFYVNLDAVIGMKSNSFILKNQEIPISRTYFKDAHRRYQDYLKEKEIK